jgi:hypothetical protein
MAQEAHIAKLEAKVKGKKKTPGATMAAKATPTKTTQPPVVAAGRRAGKQSSSPPSTFSDDARVGDDGNNGQACALTFTSAPPPSTTTQRLCYHDFPYAVNARAVDFASIDLGDEISGGGFCVLYRSRWANTRVACKRMFDPVST